MSLKLLLVLAVPTLVAVVAFPGCSQTAPCSGGETYWVCTVTYMDTCRIEPKNYGDTPVQEGICGSSLSSAKAGLILIHQGAQRAAIITNCTNTYSLYPPMDVTPIATLKPQDLPSCLVTTDDDACVSCAKTSCCGAYQACFNDPGCSCLVSCLYLGNSTATCTSAAWCGSPSPVTDSTTACLTAACPTACPGVGSMFAGLCVDPTGGAGGSTGTGTTPPSCTPGAVLTGNSCFSDADCESCYCDPGTMFCD